MMAIAFDKASRSSLNHQLAMRSREVGLPVRWHEFVAGMSQVAAGSGPIESSMGRVLFGRARLFAWQPSREAFAASHSLGGLVYLCWGLPMRGGWRDHILHTVLRRAKHVLVNDPVTREEIRAAIGRDATIAPFFVDTNYFCYEPPEGRGDFLFCNGVNDRDPNLLLALATLGHKVVWLANDPATYTQYDRSHPNLVLLRNIPFHQLRHLYQSCAMNIMPAIRDAHCAGQTTCMEALACGAPVLVSKGRTARIFENMPSVHVADTNDAGEWDEAIRSLKRLGTELRALTEGSRTNLERQLAPAAVTAALRPYFEPSGSAAETA